MLKKKIYLNRITSETHQVRAYHKKFYRPENLFLIVTGGVRPEDIFRALEPVRVFFFSNVFGKTHVAPTMPCQVEEKILSKRALESPDLQKVLSKKKKTSSKKEAELLLLSSLASSSSYERPFQTRSNPLTANEDREIRFPSSDEKSGM